MAGVTQMTVARDVKRDVSPQPDPSEQVGTEFPPREAERIELYAGEVLDATLTSNSEAGSQPEW